VPIDLSASYAKAVRGALPDALLVADRNQLVQLANDHWGITTDGPVPSVGVRKGSAYRTKSRPPIGQGHSGFGT
jgi:hypothetical protein